MDLEDHLVLTSLPRAETHDLIILMLRWKKDFPVTIFVQKLPDMPLVG